MWLFYDFTVYPEALLPFFLYNLWVPDSVIMKSMRHVLPEVNMRPDM